MNQISAGDPFSADPPVRVPLPNAPLVRVLAQVRFPMIASISSPDFIAPFQEAIRKAFPVLKKDQAHEVVFGPQGAQPGSVKTAWRFHDLKNESRVTLSSDFLAIETRTYRRREDFLENFERILVALSQHLDPPVVNRLGVRFVDKFEAGPNESLRDILPSLVSPQIAGPFGGGLGARVTRSMQEALIDLPDGATLYSRWGLVPSGTTYDPAVVPPSSGQSWVIDLDAFRSEQRDFSPSSELECAKALSDHVYTMFRWCVTDSFIRRFGGQP
jgi:uncharacterized protein (TIGR04255 family)